MSDGTIGLGSFPGEKYLRRREAEALPPEGGIPSGTEYVTRGGEKVVVVGYHIHATSYPFHGHIVRGDGRIHRTTWTQTGRNSYCDDIESPDDLVMSDAPEIDWSKLPAWANYAAMSPTRGGAGGKWPWMWFAEKPTLEVFNDRPVWVPSSALRGMIPNEFAPRWIGEAAISLVIRPGLDSPSMNWSVLPREAEYAALSHDFTTGKRIWMWFGDKPVLDCGSGGIRWTCRARCGHIPDAEAPTWAGDAQHSLMSRYPNT